MAVDSIYRKLVEDLSLPLYDSFCERTWALLEGGVPPDAVAWDETGLARRTRRVTAKAPGMKVSRLPHGFSEVARTVSFHADRGRWALLYRIVWRLMRENPALLKQSTDPDIARLFALEKEVRDEAQRMKNDIRFHAVNVKGEMRCMAYFRPTFDLLRFVAPFFARRFSGVSWSIHTPHESVFWDGLRLRWGMGVPRAPGKGEHAQLFAPVWERTAEDYEVTTARAARSVGVRRAAPRAGISYSPVSPRRPQRERPRA